MHKIKLLIPDLPLVESLLPWLRRIDNARWYTNFGPLMRELEDALAGQWPIATITDDATSMPLRVVCANSGSGALEMGIAALRLRQENEVLLPAFTFPATAGAVLRSGLHPVFADVAADTWQLTPAMARDAAKQRPLALVIPVATFGCPLDITAWDRFVEDTGIPVLMDAAAAFGNQSIGQRAHATISLHATKPFGIGEGGLFVTRDQDVAERVKRLSNFGFHHGQVDTVGTNGKLSEYAAAVALAQWSRWPDLQAKRRETWAAYSKLLATLPNVTLQSGFGTTAVPANVVLHLACATDSVTAALTRSGIETRRWYCPPLHRHPAFSSCPAIGATAGNVELPMTEELATRTIGLPWHNFLAEEDLASILEALASALDAAGRCASPGYE